MSNNMQFGAHLTAVYIFKYFHMFIRTLQSHTLLHVLFCYCFQFTLMLTFICKYGHIFL